MSSPKKKKNEGISHVKGTDKKNEILKKH